MPKMSALTGTHNVHLLLQVSQYTTASELLRHARRSLAVARQLQAALSLSQGMRGEAGIETVLTPLPVPMNLAAAKSGACLRHYMIARQHATSLCFQLSWHRSAPLLQQYIGLSLHSQLATQDLVSCLRLAPVNVRAHYQRMLLDWTVLSLSKASAQPASPETLTMKRRKLNSGIVHALSLVLSSRRNALQSQVRLQLHPELLGRALTDPAYHVLSQYAARSLQSNRFCSGCAQGGRPRHLRQHTMFWGVCESCGACWRRS